MLSLPQLLNSYRQQKKALPAFNIDSFEIFQAVEQAVDQSKLPCIVQLSPHEDDFIKAERLFLLVRRANLNGLPIYLNMDHGHDLNRLEQLARLGFDMLHFDGSDLDYYHNLDLATNFIARIKNINPNIIIEVEFNKIVKVNSLPSNDSFTKPADALHFMEKSQADLLAVSIGNLHGVDLNQPEQLDLSLFQQVVDTLPSESLFTLHGGSGIPLQQIKQAIKIGIVKININTDLRLSFKKSLYHSLSTDSSQKIYHYMSPAIQKLVELIIFKLHSYA